jgi:hypothetical protein
VEDNTELEEVLLTTYQQVETTGYSYLLWSDDQPTIKHVMSRNSLVALWGENVLTPGSEEEPIQYLLRLNTSSESQDNRQPRNYSHLVRERVIDRMASIKHALTMVYVGVKPSFIVSTKKMGMKLWVILVDNAFLLVWSTQHDLVKNMLQGMEQVRQHYVSVNEVEFPESALLVIHPLYLITKLNSHLQKLPTHQRQAFGITYLKNYLQRMMVTNHVEAS